MVQRARLSAWSWSFSPSPVLAHSISCPPRAAYGWPAKPGAILTLTWTCSSGAAVGSSVPFIAPIILLALIIAAVASFLLYVCSPSRCSTFQQIHDSPSLSADRDVSVADSVCNTLTASDWATDGRSTTFLFTRSLRHWSSCSARRSG